MKTPLNLAVNGSFRAAREEIFQNYILSVRFIYSIHVSKV